MITDTTCSVVVVVATGVGTIGISGGGGEGERLGSNSGGTMAGRVGPNARAMSQFSDAAMAALRNICTLEESSSVECFCWWIGAWESVLHISH